MSELVETVACQRLRSARTFIAESRPRKRLERRRGELRVGEPRDHENADDEWRAGSDGVGELHVFCPECWEREFGEVDARPLRSEHQGSAPSRGSY
jgi:hypothetical protein